MLVDIVIRRFAANEWSLYRTLRLRALADSPDAFGSTLAWEQALDDQHWSDRMQGKAGGRDHPIIAESVTEPVGLAWGRIEYATPDAAHLYQMWVDPKVRGRGVGRTLLDSVIEWAAASGAQHVELDLTQGNTPALCLYTSAGFVPYGDPKPLRPGSSLLSQAMRLDLD